MRRVRCVDNAYLQHFGILGQKWGVRRFQNEDGTLTEEGRKRYLEEYVRSDGKKVYYLTNEGTKAYFDRHGNLNSSGKDVLSKDPDGELGKAIRDVQFNKNYSDHWLASYNEAADDFNKKIKDVNAKWEEKGFPSQDSPEYADYIRDCGKCWTDSYSKILLRDFGEHPIEGKEWLKGALFYNQYDEYESKLRNKR